MIEYFSVYQKFLKIVSDEIDIDGTNVVTFLSHSFNKTRIKIYEIITYNLIKIQTLKENFVIFQIILKRNTQT